MQVGGADLLLLTLDPVECTHTLREFRGKVLGVCECKKASPRSPGWHEGDARAYKENDTVELA